VKAQFIVTVEGTWFDGGKPITAGKAEKRLREAVREEFMFLADRMTVRRYTPDSCAQEAAEQKGGEHADQA
jgi:hypothetical protein